MTKKSSRNSQSPVLPDPIPELDLGTVARLLRERFNVVSDIAEHEPYWVRFKGQPYNSFHPDCRSVKVMAHHRGRLLVSPRHIRHVLAVFGIDEQDFLAAHKAASLSDGIEVLPEDDLLADSDLRDGKPN